MPSHCFPPSCWLLCSRSLSAQGRILNRFSRDQDVIDNALADSLRMLSFLSFSILGTLVMMCFVQPFFALALGPILSLYYYFQMVYRRVNREIKRFDSTSRSPLFSHFAESLTVAGHARASSGGGREGGREDGS